VGQGPGWLPGLGVPENHGSFQKNGSLVAANVGCACAFACAAAILPRVDVQVGDKVSGCVRKVALFQFSRRFGGSATAAVAAAVFDAAPGCFCYAAVAVLHFSVGMLLGATA